MTTLHQYDIGYDSAGNRTSLTASGTIPAARQFAYSFDAQGRITTVTENVNLNNYVAAVTTDANGNVTQVSETWNGATQRVSSFEYDRENRLVEMNAATTAITIEHAYDGLGRLVKTSRTTAGPTVVDYAYVRDGLKVSGNIDATNSNTAPSWTNRPGGGGGVSARPVESQQFQSNAGTQ